MEDEKYIEANLSDDYLLIKTGYGDEDGKRGGYVSFTRSLTEKSGYYKGEVKQETMKFSMVEFGSMLGRVLTEIDDHSEMVSAANSMRKSQAEKELTGFVFCSTEKIPSQEMSSSENKKESRRTK